MKIKYNQTTTRALNGPFEGYPKSVILKFRDYHNSHPKVYKLFKQYANQMKESGREHYSAEIIINQIRWHHDIKSNGADVFKISNDFKPLYARLLVYKFPEFKDFFQFRQVRSLGIGSEEERERRKAL